MSKNNIIFATLIIVLANIDQIFASYDSLDFSSSDEDAAIAVASRPLKPRPVSVLPIRETTRLDLLLTQENLQLSDYANESGLPFPKTPNSSNDLVPGPAISKNTLSNSQEVNAMLLREKLFELAASKRSLELQAQGRGRSNSLDQITRSPTVYVQMEDFFSESEIKEQIVFDGDNCSHPQADVNFYSDSDGCEESLEFSLY